MLLKLKSKTETSVDIFPGMLNAWGSGFRFREQNPLKLVLAERLSKKGQNSIADLHNMEFASFHVFLFF